MKRANRRMILWLLSATAPMLHAQTPVVVPPGAGIQLQVQQPSAAEDPTASATAMFDPPRVQVGQKAYYRVQLSAPAAEMDNLGVIAAPKELKFGPVAHGQLMPMMIGNVNPISAFTYEVTASTPGQFAVPAFSVTVNGQAVTVPAATLEVVAKDVAGVATGRRIWLQPAKTNVYVGELFRTRVMLPAAAQNQIQTLYWPDINGEGFIADRTTVSQNITQLQLDGQPHLVYTYEISVTAVAAGTRSFSAQGFASSSLRNFNGTIVIKGPAMISSSLPNYELLVSDPVTMNVRPLPEGQPPGYTGSMGRFDGVTAQLSTDTVRVGQPLHLQILVRGGSEVSRLLPPLLPESRDWQVIPDDAKGMGFTLIPRTDDVHATPEIPYSSFDPETGQYVDLTVPPQLVTVQGEGLPVQLTTTDEKMTVAPLKLSDLASAPGVTAMSLRPPQQRSWLVGLLIVPVFGFFALVRWDRHRRFLEAHPEIVRRRQARRALRREKRLWRQAIAEGDAAGFVRSAANAMRIACAPHFPAHPHALVGAEVLSQLDPSDQNGVVGDTVRKIFALADAQFASGPAAAVDVLVLEAKVDTVLMRLEEKL